MNTLLLALGLVLAVEGLVLALSPRRMEELLRIFTALPVETRRALGLGALALGVALVWLAKRPG